MSTSDFERVDCNNNALYISNYICKVYYRCVLNPVYRDTIGIKGIPYNETIVGGLQCKTQWTVSVTIWVPGCKFDDDDDDYYNRSQLFWRNTQTQTHTHTHTHPFDGPLSGATQVSRYGKTIWISLKQETVSGSGISWAICKSAARSRQITAPATHHSVFTGRMPFLPPNQQRQSTGGYDGENYD